MSHAISGSSAYCSLDTLNLTPSVRFYPFFQRFDKTDCSKLPPRGLAKTNAATSAEGRLGWDNLNADLLFEWPLLVVIRQTPARFDTDEWMEITPDRKEGRFSQIDLNLVI